MVKVGYGTPVGRTSRVEQRIVSPPASGLPGTTPLQDIVAIAGLSEAEFTPRVRSAITALLAEVDRLRSELEAARRRNEHLERLTDEDSLLPVVNRRAFVRELSRMIAFARRYGSPSTLIYFDVNHMKQVNDRNGHAAGDALLQHVAATLVRSVRQSDVIGRLGGDEFGVLLGQASAESGVVKAEQLARAVSATPIELPGGQTFTGTLSFGTHTFSGDEAVDTALDLADQAMYAQKREAREG